MTSSEKECLWSKLDEIASALGGGNAATTTFRGSGSKTIPAGTKRFSYLALGGTITVGGVTIPENMSAEEQTPGGLSATVDIANGTGTAYWNYQA